MQAHAATITGKITKMLDGDTIAIDGLKIRFAHIDAPECSQAPYGQMSLDHLRTFIDVGDAVTVYYHKVGRYGRVIGEVYDQDGHNINLRMAVDGYAYWYSKYSDNVLYQLAETEAMTYGRGILNDMVIRPWEYRKQVDWEIRKKTTCR
jgi:endonuclease YncB( thermonuclease family)